MVFDFEAAQKTCESCYSKAEETKNPLYRRFNKKNQPFCLFLALVDIDMFEKQGKNFYEICPYLSTHPVEEKEERYEPPENPEDTHIKDAIIRKGCNWPMMIPRPKKAKKENGT